MGKGLRIVHLNIRSLSKNFDELLILFDSYDIILLSETWLNASFDSKLINRDGFVLFRQDRDTKINKRGGGLAAYIRSEIALYATIVEDACDITSNLEQYWLSIKESGRKHFVVGILYRPPAGSLKVFMDELQCKMSMVCEGTRNDEHVVMGDCNIDFNQCGNIYSKKLRNLMSEYGLMRLETGCTRITQRSKSTIDVIFTDMGDISDVGVRQYNISDHLPIYLIKKKARNRRKMEMVEFRNLKHYSMEGLEKLIRADMRWVGFWDENIAVDILWQTMYDIFIDSLNLLCPMVKGISQIDRPNWVTKQVIEAIREKNISYTQAQASKSDEDWKSFRVKKKSTKKLILETI